MPGRWETTRTETFSDGVFAIAITLLVLDLNIPEAALNDLWHSIGHEWPQYLAYATSFITIGGIWLDHHSIFQRLQWADARVMRINLALLMAVSFLPFPTSLVAEGLRHGLGSERAAVIVYGINLCVISLLFSALWNTVSRDRELLKPEVTHADVAAIRRATAPSIIFYVVLILVALFTPRAAAFGYLIIALISVARVRSDTSAGEPA